ncbi:unnamed protein product, partial [Tetraodon nigroviridis]
DQGESVDTKVDDSQVWVPAEEPIVNLAFLFDSKIWEVCQELPIHWIHPVPLSAAAERLRRMGGWRAAVLHIQQPSHLRCDEKVKVRVLYRVLFSRSSNQALVAILVSLSQSSDMVQLCMERTRLWLLFGVDAYSADLRAKPAHPFPSCISCCSSSCCSSSRALAFRRTGVRHACGCNPVPFPVLHRERSGSSWTDTWTSAATAARTVGAASATAVATTSPWVASTLGRTTTREGESSVTLSCRATGGSHGCWAGSERPCLGFQPSLLAQMIPLIYVSAHMREQSSSLPTFINQTES